MANILQPIKNTNNLKSAYKLITSWAT